MMKRFRNFLSVEIGHLSELASIHHRYRLAAQLDELSKRLWIKSAVLAVALLGVSFSAHASTIQACTPAPVSNIDSIRVCPGPQLEQGIFAAANTVWDAWGNDNPASDGVHGIETGDGDYNDAHVQVSFDASDNATLTWISSDSAWIDVVGYPPYSVSAANPGPVNLGPFLPGTELVLGLNTPYGGPYLSGPDRNAHGLSHWWIEDAPTPAPEPAAWLMIALGLGLMSVRLVWKGARL